MPDCFGFTELHNINKPVLILLSQRLRPRLKRSRRKLIVRPHLEYDITYLLNSPNLIFVQEEYNKLCDISFQLAPAEEPHQDLPSSDDRFSLPFSNHHIGKYTNAVYHRSGLFSTIYKALSSTGPPTLVALKVTNASSTHSPHDSHREARLLRVATSPHIISLLETFPQPGGVLVLAFPYFPYDLNTLLHPPASPSSPVPTLTVPQRKVLVRDILHGLVHIHSLGILHRDIKPSNILLHSSSGPAVLIDFGIAYHDADLSTAASEPPGQQITDVGTTSYRAPELLFGCRSYGVGIDLWALGCVIAEIVMWGGREIEPAGLAATTSEDAAVSMRQRWRENGTLFDAGELGSELALLLSVFRSLGTPTAETWPEAVAFPDWGKMEFFEFDGMGWDILMPGVDERARDLVGKLVRFENSERMSAREALEHAWVADEKDTPDSGDVALGQ